MSEYGISQIYPTDRYSNDQIDKLLLAEGIRRDGNLDYTCGMYDDDMNIIATGSCFGNTLRCMAVSSAHQGEGLMNAIVSHLISYQYSRGNMHLFLYTKCDSAKFFGDLGFHEIVRIEGRIVFMENRRTGFADYLDGLKRETDKALASKGAPTPAAPRTAALVMNANPFTNGHLYLVEKACAENDLVHLFMVSEDASLVPFAVRKRLIMEGTAHLPNLIYHESGPYVISSATFPSYFQKDETAVIESHAFLDLRRPLRRRGAHKPCDRHLQQDHAGRTAQGGRRLCCCASQGSPCRIRFRRTGYKRLHRKTVSQRRAFRRAPRSGT